MNDRRAFTGRGGLTERRRGHSQEGRGRAIVHEEGGHSRVGGQLPARPYSTSPTQPRI